MPGTPLSKLRPQVRGDVEINRPDDGDYDEVAPLVEEENG